MKKLMFAAALATVCGAVQADAISSGVVGYTTKATVEGWNYTGPVFVPVSGGMSINLQDIQMNATCPNQGANITVRNEGEGILEDYYWFKAIDGKAGPAGLKQDVSSGKNGLWFQAIYQFVEYTEEEMAENAQYGVFDDGYEEFDYWQFVTDKTFDYGSGFVINSGNESYTVQTSGAVSDDDLAFPDLVEGWNFFINPYPTTVNLQDFQMNASCPNQGANITVRNEGEGILEDYYWFKAIDGKAGPAGLKQDVPVGKNGLWFQAVYQFVEYTEEEMEENAQYFVFDDGYEEFDYWQFVADKTFDGGDGFVLNSGSDAYSLTILAPYDL